LVIGYLDDLVMVLLDILLAVKLVPADLLLEFREAAASADGSARSASGARRSL
jgi:uncharacterized membrane protein YkvA (DUF1232 family)